MKNYNTMGMIGLVAGLILGGTVVLSQYVFNAQAQVDPNDRFFEKDFCETEQTLLDDIIYESGDQISYDSGGCPISMKTIHRWNEISTARQTIITSRLATNGYEDVTNQMQAILGQ